jgi:hypothetical protein
VFAFAHSIFTRLKKGWCTVCLPLGLGASSVVAASPSNDQFTNAIPLVGIIVVTNGSNVGATKQPGEPDHAGDAGGKSVWWSWVAPFTGSVVMHTTGSAFDTLLAIYTGTAVPALLLVAANDQDLTDPLGGDTSRVKFNAVRDVTYFIAVDGFSAASGSIRLTIEPPIRPPNDNFAERIALTGATVLTNGTNREATREDGEPEHAGEPGGKSVWWTWTAPLAGTTTLWTLGTDFDTVLAVYSGDAVDDLTLLAANDQDPMGGDTSRVTFNARAGARYEIAVDGWNGESGLIVLNLRMPPPPPSLSQARILSNVAFQVTLSGMPNHAYTLEARSHFGSGAWSGIATNVTSALGVCTFFDPTVTNFPHRFYRVR